MLVNIYFVKVCDFYRCLCNLVKGSRGMCLPEIFLSHTEVETFVPLENGNGFIQIH